MSPTKNRPALGVIILGAGASSRMRRPKLLLPWGATTVVGHIIDQWRNLGAAQLAIVHRPDDRALDVELERLGFPRPARIKNPQPELGMFSSILCAANWDGWEDGLATWAIVLGDQPHLRPDTLRALLAFHRRHAGAICQPVYGGHARHPVLLPRRAFDALKQSPAQTLNDFLKQTCCQRVKRSVEDSGLALDLDWPEDYDKAVKAQLGNL